MVRSVDVILFAPKRHLEDARRAISMAGALQPGEIRTFVLADHEGPFPCPDSGPVVAGRCPDLDALDSEGLFQSVQALLAGDTADITVCAPGRLCDEVAARLAGSVGADVLLDVTSIEVTGPDVLLARSAFGGKASMHLRAGGGKMVLGAALAEEAPEAMRPADRTVDLPSCAAFFRDRTFQRVGPGGVKEAAVVVAGGRGLGGAAGFETLEALGSMLSLETAVGASRAAVDEGWARPEQQVGLTGAKVGPRLYVAIGISGASQHLAGISGAGTVIAVNTDEDAPIVEAADTTFVADWHALWPLVKERIEAAAR